LDQVDIPPAHVLFDFAVVLTVGEFPKRDRAGFQVEEIADFFRQLRIGSPTEDL
jgi:hypothetical protein